MAVLDTDAQQKGRGEHDKSNMAVPTEVATHFILIEAKIFGVFQVDLNRPACSDSQNHRVQGGPRRCEDQVIGLFARVVEATANHQPVASIHGAVKDLRQDGPIKEPLAFGSLTHRESLPVLRVQYLLLDARHITNPVSLGSLNTNHFIGRDGQREGETLLFQPEPQVRAVSVHGIGYDPADRQPSGLHSLEHVSSQFGFCLKTDRLWDMSGTPARRIVDPVFWQVQFAIDEGMSLSSYVREYVE